MPQTERELVGSSVVRGPRVSSNKEFEALELGFQRNKMHPDVNFRFRLNPVTQTTSPVFWVIHLFHIPYNVYKTKLSLLLDASVSLAPTLIPHGIDNFFLFH